MFVWTTSPQVLGCDEDILTTCDVLIWGPSLMMAHPAKPPEDSQSYSRQNTTVNKKTQPQDNIKAQLSGHYLMEVIFHSGKVTNVGQGPELLTQGHW